MAYLPGMSTSVTVQLLPPAFDRLKALGDRHGLTPNDTADVLVDRVLTQPGLAEQMMEDGE